MSAAVLRHDNEMERCCAMKGRKDPPKATVSSKDHSFGSSLGEDFRPTATRLTPRSPINSPPLRRPAQSAAPGED